MMTILTKNNKFMISTARKRKHMREDCQVLNKYQDQKVKLKLIPIGKLQLCINRK